MKFELWHAFVIGAILSWGMYVPMLHEGQSLIGGKPSQGALRAFLCVGIAYFATAVVIPLVLLLMGTGGERVQFDSKSGMIFALVAGIAGASGALCIIMSIKNNGKPMFIAPLVFAGAPIVNAIVSLLWHPPKVKLSPLFYFGMVLAAVGAGLVLYSKADMDKRSRELTMKEKQGEVQRAEATPGAP